jgi:L-ascorbate metabolism protein UlaG (beta-lactamase superfamily)
MKIKYVGHACFLVTTGGGTRIITDPYESGSYDGAVKYRPVDDAADIALVSHGHPDHNHVAGVPGSPRVVDEPGKTAARDVSILGVPCWHDTSGGSERGANIIFRIEADGLSVCHLGDLGHPLDTGTADSLLPVDVLLLPVGGFFTVGNEQADGIMGALSPKLVIPMHYRTAGVDFPIAPVEDFLEGRDGVRYGEGSEVEFLQDDLPGGILVLEPANLP